MKQVQSVSQEEMADILVNSEIIRKLNCGEQVACVCRHPDLGLVCVVSGISENGVVCKLKE